MQRFQIAFRRKKLKICNNIGGLINSGFALLEVFSIPDPHYQRSFQFRIRTIPELSEVFSIPDPHYRRSFQFRIRTNRGLSIPNPHYGKSHQFRIHTIGCLFNSGSALSPIGGLFNSGSALSEVWSITDLHYWRSFQIRIRTMKYLAFRSGVTSCRTVSRRPKKWPGVRRNWADPLEVPHVNIKDVAVREHSAFLRGWYFSPSQKPVPHETKGGFRVWIRIQESTYSDHWFFLYLKWRELDQFPILADVKPDEENIWIKLNT